MAFVTTLLRSSGVPHFKISSAVTARAEEMRKTSSEAISVIFEMSSATGKQSCSLLSAHRMGFVDWVLDPGMAYRLTTTSKGLTSAAAISRMTG
jgi:hypothetical protein